MDLPSAEQFGDLELGNGLELEDEHLHHPHQDLPPLHNKVHTKQLLLISALKFSPLKLATVKN